MGEFKELVAAAEACPYQMWAAFTDDSGSRPHTNLVSFTDRTECVLPLPGLHKNDPLVAYLWAAQPSKVRKLAEQRDALLNAATRVAYAGVSDDLDGPIENLRAAISSALGEG